MVRWQQKGTNSIVLKVKGAIEVGYDIVKKCLKSQENVEIFGLELDALTIVVGHFLSWVWMDGAVE